MIKKKYRLSGKRCFDDVFQHGQKSFNKFLGIYWKKNNLDFCRFGIIASVKLEKKSTKRNLLRRRIYSIFREFLDKIEPGVDIIVVPKKEIMNLPFVELKHNLLGLLRENFLLKDEFNNENRK